MTLSADVVPLGVAGEDVERGCTSLDAEQMLLASVLLSPKALVVTRDMVTAPMFSYAAHQRMWTAMCDLHDAGQEPTSTSLVAHFDQDDTLESIGGRDYFDFLDQAVPSSQNAGSYAAIVRDRYKRRLALATMRKAEHAVVKGDQLERHLEMIFALVSALRTEAEGFTSFRTDAWNIMQDIEDRSRPDANRLIPTGFAAFDSHYGGLRRGELLTIAGNPGSGKTAVLLQMALNLALRGDKVALESFEMTKEDLFERMLANLARVDSRNLGAGRLKDDDWPALARASAMLATLPVWVDDAPSPTLANMRGTYDRHVNEDGAPAMLGVDFVQLLDLGKGSLSERSERLKVVAYTLKAMAKAPHPMAVAALAQLNNKEMAKRADPRPRIEDIQGSSAFEQASDFVWLLYVDPENPSVIEVDVAKGRRGGRSRFELLADFSTMRIINN